MADLAKLVVKLEAQSGKLVSELERANRKIDRFGKRSTRSLNKINRGFDLLKTTIIGFAAGIGLKRVADSFVEVASSFEQMEVQLDTLTKGKGTETLEKLNTWALDMPVNTQKAVDAFVKMQAYGLNPTLEKMGTLVDVASIFGEETLPRVSRALGQMQVLGKLSAEELNQLSESGINARKYLKQAFGMNVQEIQKSGMDITKVVNAIWKGMSDEFGGAAKKMQDKWAGLTVQLKSYWVEFQKSVMEKHLFKSMEAGLADFVKKIKQFQKDGSLERWAAQTAKAVVDSFNAMTLAVSKTLKVLLQARQVSLQFDKILAQTEGAGTRKLLEAQQALAERKVQKFREQPGGYWQQKGLKKAEEDLSRINKKLLQFQEGLWKAQEIELQIIDVGETIKKLDQVTESITNKTKAISQKLGDEIDKSLKTKITKTIEYINGQKVVIYSNTKPATEKIKKDMQSSITKTISYANGHPVVIYSNIKPALDSLNKLERKIDDINHKKIVLNIKGKGSAELPITEKINNIIAHMSQIPSGMDFTANFSSMTQGFDEMRRLQEEINKKKATQEMITMVDYGITPLLGGTPTHGFATPQRQSEIESLQKQQELISNMMIASSAGGGLPSAYGATAPVSSGRSVNVNVGPIHINVAGTGGDRDLAITLASEIDHEIAGMILHNRSEIVGALGL